MSRRLDYTQIAPVGVIGRSSFPHIAARCADTGGGWKEVGENQFTDLARYRQASARAVLSFEFVMT
jgi:hypothetical protein